MQVILIENYGKLTKSNSEGTIKYNVIEEYFDCYLLSNGYFIPKNFTRIY